MAEGLCYARVRMNHSNNVCSARHDIARWPSPLFLCFFFVLSHARAYPTLRTCSFELIEPRIGASIHPPGLLEAVYKLHQASHGIDGLYIQISMNSTVLVTSPVSAWCDIVGDDRSSYEWECLGPSLAFSDPHRGGVTPLRFQLTSAETTKFVYLNRVEDLFFVEPQNVVRHVLVGEPNEFWLAVQHEAGDEEYQPQHSENEERFEPIVDRKIRWGIIGLGDMALKMVQVLFKDSENSEVVAVASKTPAKAQHFAARCRARPFDSYEELARDPLVDVVYIATLNHQHYDNAMLMLQHGKHVLLEKPFALDAEQAMSLVREARSRSLFIMEGVYFRHMPVYTQHVKSWMEDGYVGVSRLIQAQMGVELFECQAGRYMCEPSWGGGALLNIGVYPLHFVAMAVGAVPEHVTATAVIGDTGVDTSVSLTLAYGNHDIANVFASMKVNTHQAFVYGPGGHIDVPNFRETHHASFQIVDDERQSVDLTDEQSGNEYLYQIQETVRCLREGLVESPNVPHRDTINVLRVIDTAKASWLLTGSQKILKQQATAQHSEL